MKKILLSFLIPFSVFSIAQETIESDTIQQRAERSTNPNIIQEKKLFQDQDLILVRKIDPNGKDWITLNYGENNPIEISKSGEIKVQNRMITQNLTLTNIPFQETMNPNYILDLDTLEKHLKKNKTLPNFPSNNELQRSGIDVASFQMKLLKEIEELTLIIIDQNKRIESMEKDIKKMKIIMVNSSSR